METPPRRSGRRRRSRPEKSFTAGIEGPACDAQGNIYAVNFARQQTIGKITPDGKGEVCVELPARSTGNGIVFDRAGDDVRRRLHRPQRPADRPEDAQGHRLRPRSRG